MKKIIFILLLILPVLVFADSYKVKDLTINIDEDWTVFTRDNLDNNENLSMLGLDKDSYLKQMQNKNLYVDAFLNMNSSDYVEAFVIIKNLNEDKLMNLHKYKDKKILEVGHTIYDDYNPSVLEVYDDKEYKYIKAEYEMNNLYILDYYTIINGNEYTIRFHSSKEYSDDTKNEIEKMILSTSYVLDKDYEKSTSSNSILKFVITVVIAAGLGILTNLLKKKINKKGTI